LKLICRYFSDVGNDFSKPIHPSKRILKIDKEIYDIQERGEELVNTKGCIGQGNELTKEHGLKPKLVFMFLSLFRQVLFPCVSVSFSDDSEKSP
jgi:hypothetical protein